MQYSRADRRALGALLALSVTAAGRPARAQLDFSTPGSLGVPPEERRVNLERALDESRFKLGRLRLDPWWGVEELSVVDDGLDAGVGRDVTAAAGAGLKAHLPIGSRVIVAAFALPRYVWWREQAERRRLDGRYGAGAFVYFNRMSLELFAERDEAQGLPSPESDRRAHTRWDEATLAVEVEVAGSWRLYGTGQARRFATLSDGAVTEVTTLDREEWTGQAGVRLSAREKLVVAVGVERAHVEFDACAPRCGGDNDALLAQATYRGGRAACWLNVARRTLGAREGAEQKVVAGRALLVLMPERRISYHLYGSRDPYYALDPGHAYLLQDRLGAGTEIEIGWRTSAFLFAEGGTNDYLWTDAGGTSRTDRVHAFGARLGMPLGGGLRLEAELSRARYASSQQAFDRSDDVLRVGITFGKGAGAW